MTKSRVFDTARAGALVQTLGSWRGRPPAHFLPLMCIGALWLLVECPTTLHAQPTLDDPSPAPTGRQRSWNRSEAKTGGDSDLVLRIQTSEGVLLVYPSATRKDAIQRHRPYLAYWNDFAGSELYVYGRVLVDEDGVGEAIEALEQQLGVDIDLFIEDYPPLVDSGMWVFGSQRSAPWLVATRLSVLAVMGLPDVWPADPNEPPVEIRIVGGGCSICAGPPPIPVQGASVDVILLQVAEQTDCACCERPQCPACYDGDACTFDWCEIDCTAARCFHSLRVCDDHDPCTIDDCAPGGSACLYEPKCPQESDACTRRWCDDGTCMTEPRSCDDDNPCTTDTCTLDADGGISCSYTAASGPCLDDGNECTENICDNKECTHPAINGIPCLDDGNECTDDICLNKTCDHPPKDGGSCAAYASDPCKDGVCLNRACSPVPLTGPSCPDDGNECTNDVCAAGACDHPANDGILCYAYFLDPCNNGICLNKACSPVPLTGPICLDDTNECTDDVCENGNCEHPCVSDCSVCQTDRFCLNCSCVASCCEASSTTQSVSASFPSWSGFKSALESTAAAAPMIQSLALTLEGDTTATRGETCCESAVPPPASPLTYYDYSVNASLGISVTLNVPGWYWNVSHTWPDIGSVSGQVTLGPTLTLSPSASASVTGRSVPSLDCPGECVTIVGSAGIGVSGTFGGSATLSVTAEPNWLWDEWGAGVGATAEAGAGTTANLSGSYIVPGCQTSSSGFQGGQLCYGALEGDVTLSFTIMTTEWKVYTHGTFREGGCW